MASSVAFYTLGCKLNFSESSTIARQLETAGFSRREFQQGADLYVINTCSVTDHADRKCKKVVREALRYNPNAFVVIVGCYAQLKPEEISNIPGVDLVLGAAEKFNLTAHLTDLAKREKAVVYNRHIKEEQSFHAAWSFGDRTRTFLKVQDGCDYFCSFCTIPLARGRSRSDTVEHVLENVYEIATRGVKEIVLTGVNLGDFGRNNGSSFKELVAALEATAGISRFRISSIEPNLLSEEIIRMVAASEKFVPHFHIPLQSGSDDILQLMRRRYRRELYQERISLIREEMPHACIGVDVIAGFPGETEERFLETYHFLNELDISYLHVFPYSERVNTTAYRMDEVVPMAIRNERVEMLRILSEKKKRAFYSRYTGEVRPVLFESEESADGYMSGFTDNYIKVRVPYDPLLVNEIYPVRLLQINEDGNFDASIEELVPVHH